MTLLKQAQAIAGKRGLLMHALGVHPCSFRNASPRITQMLRTFVARAPADPTKRDRYTRRIILGKFLHDVRRGRGSLRSRAFFQGLIEAANVLTIGRVHWRTGIEPPAKNTNGGRRLPWNAGEPPTADQELAAWAVILEACTLLRGGNEFRATDQAYDGIGGEVPSDHAPGFKYGQMHWDKSKKPNVKRLKGLQSWGWQGG